MLQVRNENVLLQHILIANLHLSYDLDVRRIRQEDIVIVECTEKMQQSIFTEELGDIYDVTMVS